MGSPADAELLALADRCRAAWPGVQVTAEEFARHLAERGERAAAAPPAADELFLAFACLRGDRAALQAFSERYLAQLPPLLARIDPSPAFIDDVVAAARDRVLVGTEDGPPRLTEYRGQGALMGWLRITATRIALRANKRARSREARDADQGQELAAFAQLSPELEMLKRRYRPAFEAALRDALGSLSDRARKVLRLSYREGRSIDFIGEALGVHRATAARWIASARQELLEATRGLLRRRLGVADAELDSLIGLVASQLNLSLSGLESEQG